MGAYYVSRNTVILTVCAVAARQSFITSAVFGVLHSFHRSLTGIGPTRGVLSHWSPIHEAAKKTPQRKLQLLKMT